MIGIGYISKNLTMGVTDRLPLGTIDPVKEHGSSHSTLKSPDSCKGQRARISQGRDSEDTYQEVRMNFVGIDVSKSQLDIATRPDGTRWSVANSETEIVKVVETLKALSPQVIVIEATGGMEVLLVAALGHA